MAELETGNTRNEVGQVWIEAVDIKQYQPDLEDAADVSTLRVPGGREWVVSEYNWVFLGWIIVVSRLQF